MGNFIKQQEEKKEVKEIFNSKGFPKLKGTGVKQLADKRAVLLHDLGLEGDSLQTVLQEIAKQII